jgi:hypothetical protein
MQCCGAGPFSPYIFEQFKNIDTAEAAPAVPRTPLVHRLYRITSRIRSQLQKALTRDSGAQVGLFDEKKTRGRKSRDIVNFKFWYEKFRFLHFI